MVLTAVNGAILRSANSSEVNIQGDLLDLSAGNGVGTSSDSLGISTAYISADGGNGGIYVQNYNTDIELGSLTVTDGDINVLSEGDITFNQDLNNTSGGSIVLNSNGSVYQNADMSVNDHGNVTVVAGEDIRMAEGTHTDAYRGTISYTAANTVLLSHLTTDTNVPNGGRVELTGNTVTDLYPEAPSVITSFFVLNVPGADIENLEELLEYDSSSRTSMTGIILNHRISGGLISNDPSFVGSVDTEVDGQKIEINQGDIYQASPNIILDTDIITPVDINVDDESGDWHLRVSND